jgi:dTDP-4-dehydrorhamnose 3,5-epimerase
MIFTPTEIEGAYLIDLRRVEDDRGFFARAWAKEELERHGLVAEIVHCNISHSQRRGTLRGLHYQATPFEEVKVVRCARGAIYDVIVDLRPTSPTFGKWIAVELTAESYRTLYVPRGCAHGFQTLSDDVEVLYQVTPAYAPAAERGIRFDDPAFAIAWPHSDGLIISEKDRAWPLVADRDQKRLLQ